MIPTVMKIYLSDDPSSAVEVPITPNTTASDVINCCKEPGETNCHLAEAFRGKERCISENEKPFNILQQWATYSSEVKFYLRHFDSPLTDNNGKQSGLNYGNEINPGYVFANGKIKTPNGVDMSLKELEEIAKNQRQQLKLTQETYLGKQQRLNFLKQQMQQQQALMSENEKFKRLREKAEAQEAKIRKIRALRGKVDQQRYENTTMSSELEAVQALFEEKHIELSAAMLKVQELSNQLDELKIGKLMTSNFTNNSENKEMGGGQSTQLSKLKKETSMMNRVNEDRQKQLNSRKSELKQHNEEASDIDRRIEELTNALKQKKLASAQDRNTAGLKTRQQHPTSRMHTIVAAVEPLMKQPDPAVSSPLIKTPSSMYGQDVSYRSNSKLGHGIIGRIDQAPSTDQPDGSNKRFNHSQNIYPKNSSAQLAYSKRDAYSKPTVSTTNAMMRSQSAMGQFYQEPSIKNEHATAKVRPILLNNQPSTLGQYPPHMAAKAKEASSQPLQKPPSKGANIFAYKPPPTGANSSTGPFNFNRPNIKLLPNGNIRYLQSPYPRPPPPYPSTIPENSSGGYQTNLFSSQDSTGRTFTVDIEALRRKLSHAPRPLKKRSSMTEPEGPQGPAIPRLLYDHLYKKADTPFYRPSVEQTHRSTPPPAYTEPKKLLQPPPVKAKPTKTQTDATKNTTDTVSYESNVTPTEFLQKAKKNQIDIDPKRVDPEPVTISDEDDNDEYDDDEEEMSDASMDDSHDESSSDTSINDLPPPPMPSLSLVPTKGILKPLDARSKGSNRHIKFDPLALLLDASLEGELNQVKEIIDEVSDASGANDEGITALHNSVCAGHSDLVKFLVHYGSDINAADTDGWTPLHCAASCNNLSMCRFLVENGACIFAATLSDQETAADKCEELDEGYMACFEFLYGCQEKLGIARQGQVYALYDYEAVVDDELSFHDGDLLTVLRKGDENEKEWYWARKDEQEGYIPRNLIGMWPRIKPHKDQE